MHSLWWALSGFLGIAFALPSLSPQAFGQTNPSTLDIGPRADEAADPTDLSFIKEFSALGDSYAAGIGSGKQLGDILHREDWFCSRWDESYPNIMHQSEQLAGKNFKFLACSGWTSVQIKEKQVPQLADNSQQLITLSAGGNDVYLSDLLDACVYQITPGAALADKCKSVMDKTSDAIENELFGWLDDLYSALKPKLTQDGKIYVTGYAQFWNSNTKQCDDVTWKMWNFPGVHPVNLSRDNRKRMNQLAISVNNKIKEVINKNHADKIVFVDYDPYVVLLQGRFCEPAIIEPEPSRPGLLFYNRGTTDVEESDTGDGTEDSWGHTELKRAPEDVPKESFEGSIAVRFEEALENHPDWQLTGDFTGAPLAQVVSNNSSSVQTSDVADIVSSLLPDTFKRIFHPRPFLHGLIAQLVLWHIQNERAETLGLGRAPQRSGAVQPENAKCNSKPKDRPRELVCMETDWRAPMDKTSDGSASARDAIKEFCKKRNGQTAEKGTENENIYDRWDISGWGVTKRQSLWLRASSGPYSQCPKGTIEEKDCVSVMTDSLASCDNDSGYTYGYTVQGNNCMEYSIATSPSVHEGDPPWAAEPVKKYPPPETLMADMYLASGEHQIDCHTARGGQWNWDDANAAIDSYCNNDQKNGGHSEGFTVKKGSLTISASIGDRQRFPNTPYKDPEWCAGFDWEHKNTDDCQYAFRKILGEKMSDHLSCFTHYRCIQYLVRTYDDPKTKLGAIEDAPTDRAFPFAVSVNGWNETSGRNLTTNATARIYVEDLGLPGDAGGNASVFVNSL